eukprot:scaffold78367_cov35-Tisochrysis_lutea.AAC.1
MHGARVWRLACVVEFAVSLIDVSGFVASLRVRDRPLVWPSAVSHAWFVLGSPATMCATLSIVVNVRSSALGSGV